MKSLETGGEGLKFAGILHAAAIEAIGDESYDATEILAMANPAMRRWLEKSFAEK